MNVCWDDVDSEAAMAIEIDKQQGAQQTTEYALVHQEEEPPLHVSEVVASAIEELEESQHPEEHVELQEESPPQRTSTATAGYLSNLFFLLGSIIYVWLAVWDYQNAEQGVHHGESPSLLESKERLEHETEDNNRMVIHFPGFTMTMNTNRVISASAALMYVFDAVFQITDITNRTGNNSNNHLLHGLRHIPLLETSTGLAFGVGAILDFICTMTASLEDPRISRYFGVSSSYTYLLSAFLISIGKNTSFDTIADGIESCGDILFITGSIIDVVSMYVLAGRDAHEVAVGDLVFTSLWLLDAIIYILADLYLLTGCCCCGGGGAALEEDADSEVEDGMDNVLSVALCSGASSGGEDMQLEFIDQEDDDALCLDRCSSTTSDTATTRNDESSCTDAEETSTDRSSTPDAPSDLEPQVTLS